jgi:hypothetical protein
MAGGSGRARSAWPPQSGAGASPSAAKSCHGPTVTATQAILLRRKRKFGELDLPHQTSTRGCFLVCKMRSVSVGRQIGVGVGFGTSSACAARTGRPKSAPPSARLHTRSVGHIYVLQICGPTGRLPNVRPAARTYRQSSPECAQTAATWRLPNVCVAPNTAPPRQRWLQLEPMRGVAAVFDVSDAYHAAGVRTAVQAPIPGVARFGTRPCTVCLNSPWGGPAVTLPPRTDRFPKWRTPERASFASRRARLQSRWAAPAGATRGSRTSAASSKLRNRTRHTEATEDGGSVARANRASRER